MDDKHFESNIRYVAAGTSTGWTAMARTVREVDEEKVRDCKEDIDILLVFAGLFSAIMTAFLIESYQLLSPSDTSTIIDLLKQISSQTNSYTISAGFLNATLSLVAPTEPFEPSISAIRVNVLWFASLIFSLVTASFGILVKQWLREYLAGDYTSPQARLRIRQFRYPGLAHWKVFEIAAVLPLLLQLSLGLFLLGLCLFTWSVHPSIGKTSTPLIAGWAFLFVTVTIAPAFSPRCPYKTTLLKTPLKSLRGLLRRTSLFRPLYEKPWRTALDRQSSSDSVVTQLVQEPIVDGNRFLPFEEDDAALDEKNDTEMLAAVDTILLDDDLLRTTMWETLQQTIPAPSDAIKFVSQAIERRLQQNVLSAVSTSIPDLRLLSKRGWGAIVDIVADTLNKNYDFRSILPSWMEDALIILLSFNDFPLTSNGNRALSLWISSEAHAYTSRIIASHTSDYKSFTHVLRRMRSAFTLCTSEDVVTCLHYILRDRIADGDQDIAFSDILRTKPEVPEDTVHSVLLILLDVAMRRLPDDTSPWTVGVQRALNAILSTPVPTCTRPEISLLLSKLMQRETLAIGLMTEIAATTPQYQAFHAEACHNLEHAYIDNDFTGRKLILAGQISMIKAYNDGLYDDPKYLPISFIQLCHVYLCILDEAQKNDAFDAGLRSDWRELWIHMAIAARRFKLRDDDANEHANFAEICLYSLQDLDDRISLKPSNVNVVRDEMGDSKWLEGFTLEDSLFNDDLFDALSIFLPDEAAVKFKRVKHLRDLRTFIQADASLSQEISGSSMNDDEVGPEAGQIMDGENGGGMTDAGFGYGD